MDRSSSVEEEVNIAADDSLQTDRGKRSKVTPYGPHGMSEADLDISCY